MKRLILYAAAVGLTVYMAILYQSQILAALTAVEILVPVPLMLAAAAGSRLLDIKLSAPVAAAERNTPVKVMLTVKNRSIFPVAFGEAEITCSNLFRKGEASRKILFQVSAGSSSQILCEWNSSHCGSLLFEVKAVKVYDFVHLTAFRRRTAASVKTAVLPVPYEVELPPENRNAVPEDGDQFDRFHSGDDPSEVFDIREYRPGDKMSRIHWKITAKEEELMVKEYSLPLSGEGVLFLDLYRPEADGTWTDADSYLDLLFSICLAFLEEERGCLAVWKEKGGEELRSLSIREEASVYELLGSLFETCPYKTEYPLEARYAQQNPGADPAFSYRLDLEGRLWEGGKLLWESGRTAQYS